MFCLHFCLNSSTVLQLITTEKNVLFSILVSQQSGFLLCKDFTLITHEYLTQSQQQVKKTRAV